ncbi:MAG: site-specific integrase [Solirubrobacteraceae bacterium]|nr:site-specific integrase [Solirubrobacteraceae bacterium]
MTVDIKQPRGRGAGVTLLGAADAFLSSPRCENTNTSRAYAGVIDKLAAELGAGRELADIADDEIAAALEALWATAGESTWNRNRAAVNAWLSWCRDRQRWPAPAVPGSCERRKEHVDATKDLSKAAIERQLSRRDIALREKTLWRMLYETAARASEILALNVEQLDLDDRRAPIRSKGGELEWIYWGTGTAHLLPRLLRLPDGASRSSGPLFLASRAPVPARRPGPRDICPHTGRPRLGYDRARILVKQLTGWNLHQLRHSAATHLGNQKVPLQLIMAKTRHKSPRTAMRYVNPGPAAIADVTQLLDPPRRTH